MLSDGEFDVAPEVLTAKQAGDVRPRVVAEGRQLEGEPSREFVVLGICVADEQNLSRCRHRAMLAWASLRSRRHQSVLGMLRSRPRRNGGRQLPQPAVPKPAQNTI